MRPRPVRTASRVHSRRLTTGGAYLRPAPLVARVQCVAARVGRVSRPASTAASTASLVDVAIGSANFGALDHHRSPNRLGSIIGPNSPNAASTRPESIELRPLTLDDLAF